MALGLPKRPIKPRAKSSFHVSVHGPKGSWQVLKRMMEGKPVIVNGDGSSLWTLTWSFGGEGVMAPCVEPFIGQKYKEGDTFCYLQTKWGEIVEIPAALGGKLVDISVKPGQNIRQGDTIAWIEREA